MKKVAKPAATKKPPVPAESHAEIEEWMRHVMPDLQPLVRYLDERIRASVSGLQYGVKWKKAYYGLPEQGWIIELVAYDISVNIVFLNGGKFDNPPPLGDESRYVKLKSLDEAREPQLCKWIEEAGRLPGWK